MDYIHCTFSFFPSVLYSSVEGAGDCREAASNDGCWVVELTVVGL